MKNGVTSEKDDLAVMAILHWNLLEYI